ncbi:MAG TPA: Ppx/GppA phosphatase family protein [Bacillota bacterium]|nr:Ppx/GppA phosphatase family protein [Bacillota bacterium]HQE66420.1 Ppx/GppA phosphatase family protein [Bacillota bacterium]HQJ38341.1 Ppx/GppA phosphatase family protein [Bacillota bacterium]HQL37756.1 Ppx/GppA phosphatase family protein [Bacillota bacterium]
MKRTAVIDIGTNSMRLMLCKIEGNFIVNKEKELMITRIGRDVSKTGMITEKSFARNIDALKYYKNKADRYGAEKVYAIATSAVRDALNGGAFVTEAKSQAGVDVMIISGDEEAELGLRGVMSEIQNPQETVLVIDIGGGSTELVLGSKEKTEYKISIPAGAVRMTEQFISGNPIRDEDAENMRNRLNELFNEPLEYLGKKRIDRVIAIGGTATTIAAMFHSMSIYDPETVHNTIINSKYIKSIFNKLKDMSVEERWNVKGLQKERADVMPSGIFILQHIIEGLKRDSLVVSENDNLEGIVEKYVLSR